MSVEIPLFSCKFFLLLLAVSYLPPALPHLLWPSSAALMGADVTTMGLIGGNGCGGRRSVRCAGKYVILRLFGGDGDAKSGNVKDDEMLARCQDTLGPQSSSEGGLESEKMQDEENVVRGQDAWSWRASVAGGMDGGTDGAERTVALTDTSFAPGSIVQEWEIAQGLDDIFNTFTYFRNKKFGHIVELNHVRCGGFRFTTGGWTGPQWAFSSGNFLPSGEEVCDWRCSCVPDAFLAATAGREPAEGSASVYDFDYEDSKMKAGLTAEMEEEGWHVGNVTVWPGSEESMMLSEMLATKGLVLKDKPLMAKWYVGEDKEEDDPLVEPDQRGFGMQKPFFYNNGWQAAVHQGIIRIRHNDNPEAEIFLCKEGIICFGEATGSNMHMGGGFAALRQEAARPLSRQCIVDLLADLKYTYVRDPDLDEYGLYWASTESSDQNDHPFPEKPANIVRYPHPDDPHEYPPVYGKYEPSHDRADKILQQELWELQSISSTTESDIFKEGW